MKIKKYGLKEFQVFEKLSTNFGLQSVEKIRQDPKTGDVIYRVSDPIAGFEAQRVKPIIFERRIPYELAERILQSTGYKEDTSNVIRAYLINDFTQWAEDLGVDVKGEPEDILITLRPEALEKHLRAAKGHLLRSIEEMRQQYASNHLPVRDEEGYVTLGYTTFERDRMGLRVKVHPYKIPENPSVAAKLALSVSKDDLRTAKELTKVDYFPSPKLLAQSKLEKSRQQIEFEFLQREILDKIRDSGIPVSEELVDKVLAEQMPSVLRVWNAELDNLENKTETKRININPETKKMGIHFSK